MEAMFSDIPCTATSDALSLNTRSKINSISCRDPRIQDPEEGYSMNREREVLRMKELNADKTSNIPQNQIE